MRDRRLCVHRELRGHGAVRVDMGLTTNAILVDKLSDLTIARREINPALGSPPVPCPSAPAYQLEEPEWQPMAVGVGRVCSKC